jgi:hypothetical protein
MLTHPRALEGIKDELLAISDRSNTLPATREVKQTCTLFVNLQKPSEMPLLNTR